jgi:uncharacterized membrane protein YhaH (DUF805 family)
MNLVEHFFDRSGNIDRRTYGVSMAGLFWSSMIVMGIIPPAILLFPVMLYAMACLTVKRLHDIGLSGKWALMPLVAIAIYIAALLLSGVVAFGSGMDKAGDHAQAWAGAVGGWLALGVFLSAAALVVMPSTAHNRKKFGRAAVPLVAPPIPDMRKITGSLREAWRQTASSVAGLSRSVLSAGSDMTRVNWLSFFFSPKGRMSRLGYVAAFAVILFLCALMFSVFGVVPVVNWTFVIVFFYFATCLASKRLHDFGQSGWWASMPFLAVYAYGVLEFCLYCASLGLFGTEIRTDPVVRMIDRSTDEAFGYILLSTLLGYAVLALVPGQRGENRFGPPPSEAAESDEAALIAASA